uniref:Domain X domain-containing protein n=1 Tax=Spongospora subterranea TaxID=70186 RepID=A0A0H5R890_9EUKA|eukprot:CRZ10348.1 hypothetical protein [Spongospora subterranea]
MNYNIVHLSPDRLRYGFACPTCIWVHSSQTSFANRLYSTASLNPRARTMQFLHISKTSHAWSRKASQNVSSLAAFSDALPKFGNSFVVPDRNRSLASSEISSMRFSDTLPDLPSSEAGANLMPFLWPEYSGNNYQQKVPGEHRGSVTTLSEEVPSSESSRGLYHRLLNRDIFHSSLIRLQNAPNSMITHVEPGLLNNFIDDLVEQLRLGTFAFLPKRNRRARTKCPIGAKKKERDRRPPVDVIVPPIFRDQLVLQAMTTLLETVYEPKFSPNSHGYRSTASGLSRQSALKQIRDSFGISSWFIDGKLTYCIDDLDHGFLFEILRKEVKDARFIALIQNAVKAGLLEFRRYGRISLCETPMGTNPLSPLLANICLNELDMFVHILKKDYDKGSRPGLNPKFRLWRAHIDRLRRNPLSDPKEIRSASVKLREMSFVDEMDPNFRRLFYVRHADRILIGLRGPKADAIAFENHVKHFLSKVLGLPADPKIVSVRHARSEGVEFLGTDLYKISIRSPTMNSTRRILRLMAPKKSIKMKLINTGFIQGEKSKPYYYWSKYSLERIVWLYSAVFKRILRHYSFVANTSALGTYFHWIIRGSCAKLLAAKLKLSSQRKIFTRFGKFLSVDKNFPLARFYRPQSFARADRDSAFLEGEIDYAVSVDGRRVGFIDESVLCANCQLCGASEKGQIHLHSVISFATDLDAQFRHLVRRENNIPKPTRWNQIALCPDCSLKYCRKSRRAERRDSWIDTANIE